MIKTIWLHNFQSHKRTRIKFVDGVNAIVGNSDSGKSAILRAFEWVVYNRPVGDDYLSHWAEEISVTILFDDGAKITRGRDKQGNYYKLNGEVFRAFKQEVPVPIQEALNLNDINIQAQMDPPFLISFKPGDAAQLLNKAVNLDIIDTTISNIRKKKLDADRDYKQSLASIEDYNNELKKYNYLKQMEADVILYESAAAARSTLARQIKGLQELINLTERLQERTEASKKLLRIERRLNKALESVEERNTLKKEIVLLGKVLNEIRKARDDKKYWEGEKDRLQKELEKSFPDICPLCGK